MRWFDLGQPKGHSLRDGVKVTTREISPIALKET
jgi:hypothetical protein